MSVSALRAVPSNGDIEIKAPMADVSPQNFNEKTVFRRTGRGTEECRNRNSPLPQRLKSILLLVDGRAPVSRFLESLTVYGDVSELFQVLIDLSMIEPITALHQVSTQQVSTTDINRTSAPVKKEPATLKFDDLIAPTAGLNSTSSLDKSAVSKSAVPVFSRASASAALRDQQPAYAPIQSFQSNANDANFKRALNQVNDWIPDLFGAEAMEIMLELEKCADKSELVTTVAELKPMMMSSLGAAETNRRFVLLNDIFAGRA